MRTLTALAIVAVAALTSPTPASSQGSSCRFYLASQYDWSGSTGFYLDLEGSVLADLPLILGVADGSGWRFPLHRPAFVAGSDYHIRAVIAPDRAQLFLDGGLVADSPGSFQPASGVLEVAYRPGWATEKGDWLAVVAGTTVSVVRDGSEVERRDFDFGAVSTRPIPLQLFEPGTPSSAALAVLPGDTVTVDVSLRFTSPDPADYAPLIDQYGQCIYADWPEKVRSDADLVADIAAEDAELALIPPSPDFDEYGGSLNAGWHETPTGFFRVVRRDGYWWLVSPLGNPCFYLGVCTAPAQAWPGTPVTERESYYSWLPSHEEPWTRAWMRDPWGAGDDADFLSFSATNLIRKYGDDWLSRADERAARRIKSFGFSGGGKWGSPTGLVSTPVLGRYGTPSLVNHPDVFDPAVQEAFRADLASQVASRTNDPTILGWTVGSERAEVIFPEEITQVLALPATTPAKRALLDYAVDQIYAGSVSALAAAWGMTVADRDALYASTPTPTATDLELMRRHYADRYYGFIYTTMKSIDPNHLYLGCYICPGCQLNDANWPIIAAHCDVMSYDRYTSNYEDGSLARLQKEVDKPHFCGEFSFPPWYDGWRGFGRYPVYSAGDADAAEAYARAVNAAALDPYCVGLNWFEYKDQPLTGRGPGHGSDLLYGEHFAFGLVTETDRVRWDMVRRMREVNLQATQRRLESVKGPFHDVPPDYWAAREIGACVAAGIVAGYPDGTYRPRLAVTRDQMAVYVARALAGGDAHVPTGPGEIPFTDVPADHWAVSYIRYAKENSIVVGYDDGTYRPAQQVDRGQMAVYIARSIVTPTGDAGLVDYLPPDTPTFADVTRDNAWSWCYRYVEYIALQDIARGYPGGLYHPESVCSRDQMAVFVARAFALPF